MIFWWICEGESGLPVLFLCHLRSAPKLAILFTNIVLNVLCLVAQSCPTLCYSMDYSPPGSTVHRDSPGKNTGVSSHALLPGIFPTQLLNPGFPHCRQILYCLSCQGSPRTLVWVGYPFLRGSSQAGNQTRVSCIARGFFTSWATREALTPAGLWCVIFILYARLTWQMVAQW